MTRIQLNSAAVWLLLFLFCGLGLAQNDASPFDATIFYCTECLTEVPEHIGAGAQCPHCGAFFESATNADGSETQAAVDTGWSPQLWCGIGLFTLFAAEYAFRRLRKRTPPRRSSASDTAT